VHALAAWVLHAANGSRRLRREAAHLADRRSRLFERKAQMRTDLRYSPMYVEYRSCAHAIKRAIV
jgi:hypothetical protein